MEITDQSRITPEVIEGFTSALLMRNFDNPRPTPEFHRELWEMCASDRSQVAIAAPRGHAKSTCITHAYTLASVLFRERQFVIIISETESQSILFLEDIKAEILENEDLIALFGTMKLKKDTSTDIVVEMHDGYKFRIIAKGSEQKIRGLKWGGKRPDLIVGDDLESDESVLSKERREKFRNWFFSAVLPALSEYGVIRIVGTVLHMDSLLERLLKNSAWYSKRFQAHGENFSDILWPDLWPRERLEAKRVEYIEEGFPEGYSQEYLNWPIDAESALFRRKDFLKIQEEDWNKPKTYYAAADFAISEKEKGDSTVIVVGGVDNEGYLHIVDIVKGRYDSLEIMERLFEINARYSPEMFIFETEKVDKALGPFLDREMMNRGEFFRIEKMTPTKDKIQRAQGIAARMRQGGVKFDQDADWFPDLQDEMMKVTRSGVRGRHDDQLDAMAWLGLGINKFFEAPTRTELEEDEWREAEMMSMSFQPKSIACGY